MRPPRIDGCRMRPVSRSIRSPNARIEPPLPRQFSQKHPRRLLVSTNLPRPQLPFLYPSSTHIARGQLNRLISTQNKKFIKETAKLTAKYTVYIWLFTTLATIAGMGILSERQERAFPSPHEWSLYTRFRFRRAKWWEIPENNEGLGFPNYAAVYCEYEVVLNRLEDVSKDGAGVLELEDGFTAPGLGKGLDLTAKSEEWRQGYYEVLMGMGRAAERMEGWVTTKSRENNWAPEFIASPTNPRPKVPPPGMPLPPDEDQRMPVTEPPEKFYLKVLTSKGFTTYQRMSAAIAYADWLSFKQLITSAEEMYRWALDIAKSGLPTPDFSSTIDPDTAILKSSAPKDTITPNIVYAATNLATHFALTGNISAALPIFVSVLRARRSADPAPPSPPEPPKDSSLTGTLTTLLQEPAYPPLPPSGDEPLLRREEDQCEEAALMNYIGEILFATAVSESQRQQGLRWVRDGVSAAKSAQLKEKIQADSERKVKCQQCEEVGLESWGKIMTFLTAEAKEKQTKAKSGGITGLIWKLRVTQQIDERVEELEQEEEGVTLRLAKLRDTMLKEYYAEQDMKYAKTFVF
ncbi:hypothetical protein GQ43DRAFT_436609 [Delitschia confertaspora ATCC 74209]|uniref:Uncharacterized protein n=1 Tax=Delitschia confertaspora ATCC 74209 TaxID=1513339 RepID=A0A9P4JWY4_9PLEO|nr:hypothetical protein GQ43DRAFT_436609 [Delitschia confertaspora ATCC 74209]